MEIPTIKNSRIQVQTQYLFTRPFIVSAKAYSNKNSGNASQSDSRQMLMYAPVCIYFILWQI